MKQFDEYALSRCVRLAIRMQRRSNITHRNYESDIWFEGDTLDRKVFYTNPDNDFFKYPIKLEKINYKVLNDKVLSSTNYNNTFANDVSIDSLIVKVYKQHDVESTETITMDGLLHIYIGDAANSVIFTPCLLYEVVYNEDTVRSLISEEYVDYGNLANRGYHSKQVYYIYSYGYHLDHTLQLSIDSICLSTDRTPNGLFISKFNNIMITNTPRMVYKKQLSKSLI